MSLNIRPPVQLPGAPHFELRTRMKVVARFSTPAEAHVVISRLESAGIQAVVRDEFTVTFDWFYSNAIGGVKIEVIEEDLDSAREILRLPASEPGLIQCPFCGSSDSSVRVLSAFGAFCALVGIPIPMTRAFVDCRSCKKTYNVPIDGRTASGVRQSRRVAGE